MSRRNRVTLPPPPDLDVELLKEFENIPTNDLNNLSEQEEQQDEHDDKHDEEPEPIFTSSKEQIRQYAIGGACFLCALFAMYIVAI